MITLRLQTRHTPLNIALNSGNALSLGVTRDACDAFPNLSAHAHARAHTHMETNVEKRVTRHTRHADPAAVPR